MLFEGEKMSHLSTGTDIFSYDCQHELLVDCSVCGLIMTTFDFVLAFLFVMRLLIICAKEKGTAYVSKDHIFVTYKV